MNLPVFEHTINSLHYMVNNEKEPLQKVSRLIKYDPGLYFSLLQHVNKLVARGEITSISQAVSLIGAEGIENHILGQDYFLNEDYILLWCYSVLAGEAAICINNIAGITEDEEEAFFAGILSTIGTLLMLKKYSNYAKILDLLLKIPLRDKIFIENRLFKTNQLKELQENLIAPETYKNIIALMTDIFGDERPKDFVYPPQLSSTYESFQLLQLTNISEVAARLVLFPSVVDAQEKFRELSVRYFRIPETETEELLADIFERFESVCKEFMVENLAERFVLQAKEYHSPKIKFQSNAASFKKSLEAMYKTNQEDRNIFIYGGMGVGKRLLALALHHSEDNPRKAKPFLSVHCSILDNETLEIELLGAKGGFLGIEKHKGALELANGGTILLKDIDRIPLSLQDRLSEIFCKSESYKIGETHPFFFDVRFLITSRKNIFEEAKEGRFSERLLRVLKPVSIYIPPLQERREDIEFIADSIIEKYELNLEDKALKISLREYYETHPFNENLLELKRLLFFLSARHSLKA